MNSETELIEFEGWTIRLRRPQQTVGLPPLLLVHGWTGNEDVTWIFAQNLPTGRWILAPRGIFPSPEGGYGWLADRRPFPTLEDFRQPADALLGMVDRWAKQTGVANEQLDLMGFSQGGALCYAVALLHPERVSRLAALASFMPEEIAAVSTPQPLKGKRVYVSHGSNDKTVPVERGREAVRKLKEAGADVTYCESDAGHKLSLNCLHGLEAFFS